MDSEKIKTEIENMKTNLESLILKTGTKKSAEITGEAQTSICNWLKGDKRWAWEKIVYIAGKLGL